MKKKFVVALALMVVIAVGATSLAQAANLEAYPEALEVIDQSEQVAFIADSPEYVVIRDGNLYKGELDDTTGTLKQIMTGVAYLRKNPIAGYTVYGSMPSEIISSEEFPDWLSVCYVCGNIKCLYIDGTISINDFQIAQCHRIPSAYSYVYKGEDNLVFDIGDEDLVWIDDVHYDHSRVHFGEHIPD